MFEKCKHPKWKNVLNSNKIFKLFSGMYLKSQENN